MIYYAWSCRPREAVCALCGRTFVTSSRVQKYCHRGDCESVLVAKRKTRKETLRKTRKARKVGK